MSYRGSYIQFPSPVPLTPEQVKEIKDRLQLLSKVWDEELIDQQKEENGSTERND